MASKKCKLDVALCLDENNAIFIGEDLFPGTKVRVRLVVSIPTQAQKYFGFELSFPITYPDGVGRCFNANGRVMREYILLAKFPSDICSLDDFIPSNATIQAQAGNETLNYATVTLNHYQSVQVSGFGLPFTTTDPEVGLWINQNAKICGVKSLIDIFQSRRFRFAYSDREGLERFEETLQSPSTWEGYPYGSSHSWSWSRYTQLLPTHIGPRFDPSYKFDTIHDMLTCLTQPHVQDIYWYRQDIEEISYEAIEAALVSIDDPSSETLKQFYVVLRPTNEFLWYYRKTWQRISKTTNPFFILIKADTDHIWQAELEPNRIPDLYPVGRFVLRATQRKLGDASLLRPRKISDIKLSLKQGERGEEVFNHVHLWFDQEDVPSEYDDVVHIGDITSTEKRRVAAVNGLLPTSKPQPIITISTEVRARMSWFSDLICGNGFWKTYSELLRSSFAFTLSDEETTIYPPKKNMLNIPNNVLKEMILSRVEEGKRETFLKYMENSVLGLVVCTGFAGSGKSYLLSVIVSGLLASPTFKKIYVSGPTNASTDIIASRIFEVSTSIIDEYNLRVPEQPMKHLLVLRGYPLRREEETFWQIVSRRCQESRAHVNSIAFYALQVLGFEDTFIPPLHENCSEKLRRLRDESLADSYLKALVKMVQTGLDVSRATTSGRLTNLMKKIIHEADVICTTPHMATSYTYKKANDASDVIVFDEAGAMCRADAIQVWGNTFRPCVIAGDEKQLPPTIMSVNDKLSTGFHCNRFGLDGQLSILEHIKGMGWRVFELDKQYRMVKGAFDLSQRTYYPELNGLLTYGPTSDNEHHPLALKVEQWLSKRHLRFLGSETACPVLFSIEGLCETDEVGSRSNEEQNECAVSLGRQLMTDLELDPKELVFVTMYGHNKVALEKMIREDEGRILQHVRCYTVDAFQGHEASVVVLVLCVNTESGTGFVEDCHRLNCSITRHTDFLFVIGDAREPDRYNDDGWTLYKGLLPIFTWFRRRGRILDVPYPPPPKCVELKEELEALDQEFRYLFEWRPEESREELRERKKVAAKTGKRYKGGLFPTGNRSGLGGPIKGRW